MILTLASLLTTAFATTQAAPAERSEAISMRKARDPNIAVHEELCMARRARTTAAYDLFIARHPKHPLADVARKERNALGSDRPRQ